MRLFIAVDPSATQRKELEILQHRLAGAVDGVRWVRPEGLHLTLKFLGEQGSAAIDPITDAMEKAAASTTSFTIQFGRTGVFPSAQRARVIWAGITAGSVEVQNLAALLDAELVKRDFPVEKRPFKAHLTLGRVGKPQTANDFREVLAGEGAFRTEKAAVQSMRLFESRLSPQGAHYLLLKEIHLVN